MPVPRVPKYSRQRESGRSDRAYVTIDGKKIKLGKYGSPESKQKYAELIKADEGGGARWPPPALFANRQRNADRFL